MSLTITFAPAILNALEEEASARSISCEQIIREAVEERYSQPPLSDAEYETWFRAMYEQGKAAYDKGDVCSHEEVKKDMAMRRKQFLARLSKTS